MTLSRNLSTLGQAVTTDGKLPTANLSGSIANTSITGTFPSTSITGLATSATTDTSNASNIITGTLPDARLSTLYNPIGVGQTWSSQTRSLSTTYTNTTGRTIAVAVSMQAASSGAFTYTVIVGGVSFTVAGGNSTSNIYQPNTFIVPAGATYQINNGSIALLTGWMELR
jgi:hypothetical protein